MRKYAARRRLNQSGIFCKTSSSIRSFRIFFSFTTCLQHLIGMPKLSIFSADEKSKLREQVDEAIKTLKNKDLAAVLEFIKTAKG